MDRRADVAVIGAGILGLAVAWEAARRGRSVVVFERSARAEGASIRNFGMVWPIGQPPGADYARAIRARQRWIELKARSGIWVEQCGSVHAVYEDDEDAVLREFAAAAPDLGIACEYLDAADAARRFPTLNPGGLRGALFSPTEMCVDPRQAIALMPQFLSGEYDITFQFGTAITSVDVPLVRTANGEEWRVGRAVVCSGADFETLFPASYAESGVRRCKLQMMRTASQPNNWRLGPHLAGGLTLGHYKSFEVCPTLPAVKARHAAELPEFVRHGVHVMASQNQLGEVVIGDSHHYGDDISPFENPAIDEMILDYLANMVRLPDPKVAARWTGIYVKHPTKSFLSLEPAANCSVLTAPGGAGMTLAFGAAQDWWDAHDAE